MAEKSGVTRQLGKVVKARDGKPIMVADKPWEAGQASQPVDGANADYASAPLARGRWAMAGSC